jgi:hypothetical protein
MVEERHLLVQQMVLQELRTQVVAVVLHMTQKLATMAVREFV